KELVDSLMHLWTLANSYSLDSANSKKDRRIANKKRRFEDINTEEDGSKKQRIENYKDKIIFDTAKKTNLEATHKQIPPILSTGCRKFSCNNCGKSFSSYQALGGHKSSCNSNLSRREVVVESALLQGYQIDESSKKFATS
ncbi:hypothetical protein MKX01_034881, partial [Papaver californicum]